MGYNQFTINNYRNTLAKQCSGKVIIFLSIYRFSKRVLDQTEILSTTSLLVTLH
jgi:hypothetical protein